MTAPINVASLTITSTGAIDFIGSGISTVSGDVNNSGDLGIDDSVNGGGTQLVINGTLTNSGTIFINNDPTVLGDLLSAGTLDNTGTIELFGDGTDAPAILQVTGATSGSGGLVQLDSYSAVFFGEAVAAGQTVTFSGIGASGNNTVLLAAPGSFAGDITGFGDGDTIYLLNETVTGLSYANSTLTATISGGGTQTFSLTGSFNGIAASSDGLGDTVITAASGPVTLTRGTDVLVFVSGNNEVDGTAATVNPSDSLEGTSSDTLALSGGKSFDLGALASFRGFGAITLADGNNYSVTTGDANVASGAIMIVDGSGLTGVNRFTFKGAAETDGSFIVLGGAGSDRLTGGASSDFLKGGGGADTLTGGGGTDFMEGDAGNDIYFVDDASDQVVEDPGGGTDTVYASGDYTLAAGQEIEYLRANAGMTGLTLTGNEFANILVSGAGDDTLAGAGGNDTYYVNSAGDVVQEAANGGTDIVVASVSYTLGAGQEIETLKANAGMTGLTLTGNELANTLISGAGDDTLIGAAGNDTYYVNSAGDVVQEAASGGTDIVYAGLSYTLAAGQEIERLKANAGSVGLTLTGNEFANTFISGAGNDTLVGGDGNDVYYVNNGGDVVQEAAHDGNDIVLAGVNYTLGDGQEIERVKANAGTTGLTLIGNDLANIFYSGAGDDTLVGKGGNDTYFVNNAGDQVTEAANGGTDRVLASVNYTLGAGQEIESLRANADTTGLTLTGNELANTLIGGAGNDVLAGRGGNDKLLGGDGNDTFFFDTAPASKINDDGIADFTVGQDMIDLSQAIYTALSTGTLAASAFTTGSHATTADQHVIYNSVNGALYYDADGNGVGAQVQFAKLSTGLAMTNNQFNVTA